MQTLSFYSDHGSLEVCASILMVDLCKDDCIQMERNLVNEMMQH